MKIKYKIAGWAFIIYYIAYFSMSIVQSDKWGNILSPMVALIPALILFKLSKDQRYYTTHKKEWLCVGMSCFAWFLADFLWAIYYFTGFMDPGKSTLIAFFYLGTNLFLLAGVAIYAGKQFRKWHFVQLLVDAFAITLCVFLLLWILFFDRSFEILRLTINDGIITFLTISSDILIFTLVSIWFFSIRRGNTPIYIRLIMGSIALFCITDIVWVYLYLGDLYTPNSVIDGVYTLFFVLISIAGFLNIKKEKPIVEEDDYANIGTHNKIFLAVAFPLTEILFQGFSFASFLNFLFILSIYKIANTYIQYSAKNEELLKKEINLNHDLEDRIYQRTIELIEKNKLLDSISKKDEVTGLYNRRYFMEKLNKEINLLNTVQSNDQIALVFIDIDKFKSINDLYGHGIGDQVLQGIADKLKIISEKNSVLSRFGGDEFIMYVKGDCSKVNIGTMTDKIIHSFTLPIEIGPYFFKPTASIGVSIYPKDATNVEELINNADIAMYGAKKYGRNKASFYNNELSNEIRRASKIEHFLHNADFDKDFELYYQPKFNSITQEIVGVEALLRWHQTQLGYISPAEFIPIAEESDLIIDIGFWVVEQAIKQISLWNNTYNRDVKMGINISPKQLDQKDLLPKMNLLLDKYSARPSWIDIEIIENIAMSDEGKMFEIANQFKTFGITISIDDFGTGYSSLNYLRRFPFNTIKIAKPLIDNITTNHQDFTITKFIIQLAKSLGINTVAEGVETKGQMEILKELNCDEIQGFLLGKPMPARKFEALLQHKTSQHLQVSYLTNG